MEPLPWKHSVPTSMTWFQGQNPFNHYNEPFLESSRKGFTNKRKSSFIDDSPLPSKQYVSEEAMAAHLNQLHIGNNYFLQTEVPEGSVNCAAEASTSHFVNGNLSSRIQEDFHSVGMTPEVDFPKPQLILSPELATIKPEPILPKCILDQIRKPSMELVLWKPPVGMVDSLIRSALAQDDAKDENTNKINGRKCNGVQNDFSKYYKKQDSPMQKPFQLFRVVPAMTSNEIEIFEEEMNMI